MTPLSEEDAADCPAVFWAGVTVFAQWTKNNRGMTQIVVVVVGELSVFSSGQRSCPGFWPLLLQLCLEDICTAWPGREQTKRWTYQLVNDSWNIGLVWSFLFFFFFCGWCIVYTAIDGFCNCHRIWTAACVSMNLTLLPLHFIDPAPVFNWIPWSCCGFHCNEKQHWLQVYSVPHVVIKGYLDVFADMAEDEK